MEQSVMKKDTDDTPYILHTMPRLAEKSQFALRHRGHVLYIIHALIVNMKQYPQSVWLP